MITITWTPEAVENMSLTQQHFPFDETSFRNTVNTWLRGSGGSWPNGSTHSREFPVAGPAVSLTANVATQLRTGDTFHLVMRVYRD